jgi:hypothetical protein
MTGRRIAYVPAFIIALGGIAAVSKWAGGRVAFGQAMARPPAMSRLANFEESFTGDPSNTPALSPIKGFAAVRRDGAFVHGRYLVRPDGKTYLSRRIVHPDSGLNIVVMDDIRATTTTYLPENHPDRLGTLRPDPQADCTIRRAKYNGQAVPTGAYLGRDTCLGYDVVVVSTKSEMRPGVGMKVTRWFAPALDCQELRSLWEWTDDTTGRVTSSTDHKVTSVVLGEPPSALFDVPPQWVERGPTISEEEYLRLFKNGETNPNLYMHFARREKIYEERQRPR